MANISIYELQVRIEYMMEQKGYKKASAQTLTLGICEEAGELAKAILLTQSPDYTPNGSPEEQERNKNVAAEIGDLITYTIALCNKLGIEPEFQWMKKGF